MREFERALALLRAPGTGPFILRIGGDSADHSVLDLDISRRLPRGIFDVQPGWFHAVSLLVTSLRARLILDLNLVSDTPLDTRQWARAATAELPRGSVADYEIGNEPDLYTRRYWTTVFSPIDLLVRALPVALTPRSYVRLFDSSSRVLMRMSSRVGLAGPVVAYPAVAIAWVAALLHAPHPGLRLVTAHEYPYSSCVPRLSPRYPTIARLLSEHATAGTAALVRPAIRLAHKARLPLRLTELNSVTCGGRRGVSDAFATALWAPDALFELMKAGADGVNIHVRAFKVNAAFVPTRNGIVSRPLMYGLILFTRMLGPDARLVPTVLAAPATVRLKAWAVRVGQSELRLLIINKGAHAVRTLLRLPAVAPARVERLLAPSPAARSGVTLDGQRLSVHEQWVGHAIPETIQRAPAGYELTVPAASAALIRVQTEARAR
jgi:hypothetical protein